MGMIRPTNDAPVTGSSFLGFQEASVLNVNDRTGDFSWADLYIDIPLATQNSNYASTLRLKGTFKRNSDGTVIANSKLVKDIYAFFDAVGYDGGVTSEGTFCDKGGRNVVIANELSKFASGKEPDSIDHTFDMYVYVYKEWNKKNQRAYTVVHNYIQQNNPEGREKLESRIEYLKSNGLLNEATQAQMNTHSNNGTPNTGRVTIDDVLNTADSII